MQVLSTYVKRFISVLLVLILCFALLPANVSATSKNGNYKMVALTFDDGPGDYTGKLLDALKKKNAKATFFMLGERLASSSTYRKYLKRMVNEGHQIANHTYSHPMLTECSSSQITNQINDCRKYLVSAGGNQKYYIRPPYGDYNSTVRNQANAPLIMWSVDPQDWECLNTNTVVNRVLNDVRDGDIILLHDIYSTSVNAAIQLIDKLQSRGYELVTVSELLRRRGITPKNGQVYFYARNTGTNLGPYVEPDPEYYDESKLNEHWAYGAICEVLEREIFAGTGNGTFGPNKYMRRGMFATVLGAYDGHGQTDTNTPFSDVNSNMYYASHILWAWKNGIMTGYGNNKFGPEDPLTREQAAVIMVQYLSYLNQLPTDINPGTLKFKDASSISSWAKDSVAICVELGLFSGYPDGTFQPKKKITRAEAAVVMLALCHFIESQPVPEPEPALPSDSELILPESDQMAEEAAQISENTQAPEDISNPTSTPKPTAAPDSDVDIEISSIDISLFVLF